LSGLNGEYYGFSYNIFHTTGDYVETTTSFDNTAFRFIGANENNGNRWSVGDKIDVFVVDDEHAEFKDNNEFVLLSASTLAVSGIALLSLVLM
jgi:hypothetical protein